MFRVKRVELIAVRTRKLLYLVVGFKAVLFDRAVEMPRCCHRRQGLQRPLPWFWLELLIDDFIDCVPVELSMEVEDSAQYTRAG